MKKILMCEFHQFRSPMPIASHHYARHFLGQGGSVFWLSHYVNVYRYLRKNEVDLAYLENYRGPHIRETNEGQLTEYSPFPLIPYLDMPLLGSEFLGKHFLRTCVPPVLKILNSIDFHPVDVLWITNPRHAGLIDFVPHKVSAYRMSDNMAAFEGEPKSLQTLEEDLCKKVDIVFATARNLLEKASHLSKRAVYFPNGVDPMELSRKRGILPLDLVEIPNPRILYIGALGEWFDYRAVYDAVRQLPHLSFIFLGKVTNNKVHANTYYNKLLKQRNAHFLGSKKRGELAGYFENSDVGLIPFQVNSLTNSVSPIKLFEYLHFGLPVVCSEMEEVVFLEAPVVFYGSTGSLKYCIEKALTTKNHGNQLRTAFCEQHSWEANAIKALRLLNEIMESK